MTGFKNQIIGVHVLHLACLLALTGCGAPIVSRVQAIEYEQLQNELDAIEDMQSARTQQRRQQVLKIEAKLRVLGIDKAIGACHLSIDVIEGQLKGAFGLVDSQYVLRRTSTVAGRPRCASYSSKQSKP